MLLASYASGHLRIYGIGPNAEDRVLQAEIGAHARCITALHVHPTLPIFASVGEDCVVNVWSFPNASTMNTTNTSETTSVTSITASSSSSLSDEVSSNQVQNKIVLDMSSVVPHQILTGVQFVAHPDGASNGIHIVAAAFDWTSMRVFFGLGGGK